MTTSILQKIFLQCTKMSVLEKAEVNPVEKRFMNVQLNC